jgi:hypothetical protein
MNAQEELERLKRQVEQLQKRLAERQQLDQPKSLPALRDNYELVADCARFAEGLLSEKDVRKKWRFDESTWESLGSDDELARTIEEEKTRRIRDGSYKRERSQQLVTKAPDVLDGIMMDAKANARHKVDAIKTLDALADPGSQRNPADEDRVIVTINMGGDSKLVFDKPIRPTPADDKIIDVTPTPVPGFMIPAEKEDRGGEPV